MNDETRSIQLTRGAVVTVSADDYEMLSQHKWYLSAHGYAARTDAPTRKRYYMHRVINQTPAGMHTDHVDGNKLNCTRGNLRTVTVTQNMQNKRKARAVKSSRFKGVNYRAPRGAGTGSGCWAAHIKYDGKKRHLGHYVTEFDAAWRYNIEAQRVFGEFAKLNVLPLDFLASKPGPTLFLVPKYSKYRGVTWSKQQNSWLAYVAVNGKRVHTSFHDTEEEAAVAFNAAAVKHHGEKARLNHFGEGQGRHAVSFKSSHCMVV